MENLYKKVDVAKKKNRSKTLDLVLSNNKTTLKVIEYVFSQVYNYLYKTKYEDCNYDTEFDSHQIDCRHITISGTNLSDSLNVPQEYITELYEIINNFLLKYGLGRAEYSHYKLTITISLYCTVKQLKEAIRVYNKFIESNKEDAESNDKVVLSDALDKFDYAQTLIEDDVVENVFCKLYEKNFLDKRMRNLISRTIDSIDQNNSFMDPSFMKIDENISYSTASDCSFCNDDEIIPNKYFDALFDFVHYFIVSNNLGKVDRRHFPSDCQMMELYMNCSLKDLLEAYYMEKQRIEYLLPAKAKKAK